MAQAQAVGDCEPGQAEAVLDVGNVRALIHNTGGLFWPGSPNVYEVPKGSGDNVIQAATLWIGGLVEDTLRMAATNYGPYEFWPGPLDDQGLPPTVCSVYDQIYEIRRADLEIHAETGLTPENLEAWPWQLGAPVLDGDGVLDNYNLEGGDRPALIGDQMLWWVMNDAGGEHPRTRTKPLGLEVQGVAFAFNHPSYLGNTTFYRYKLIYKGVAPLRAAYISLFVDASIGADNDDYIGSDTTLALGFTYNNDNDNEQGYGPVPPALGATILRGPLVSKMNPVELEMASFIGWFAPGGVTGFPSTARDYYHYMKGRWMDGRPITVGGRGTSLLGTPTPYLFSGDPVTRSYWSMLNHDGNGAELSGGADGHMVVSSGPFEMAPGEEQEVTFAIVTSRGSNFTDSIRQLKVDVRRLREVAPVILQPRVDLGTPPPEPRHVLVFAENYPNPFSTSTTIRYSLPQAMRVRLSVYDVLGRKVAILVDEPQESGVYTVVFDAGELPDGVYFYRIEMDHLLFTKKMLLVR